MRTERFFVMVGSFIFAAVSFGILSGCTIVFQKGRRSDIEKIKTLEDEVDRLTQLKAELEEKLRGIEGVSLKRDERGLVITFLDEILFDSGKAKIKSEAFSILDKLTSVVVEKASDLNIGVEGHTDNEPIKYSGWKSNWELSTARATSVLHYLAEKGVRPEKLVAIGYGEFRPVAANDSAESRRKNRRVEVVILPELKKSVPSAPASKGEGMLEPKENLK